ncbi:hypothetical protein [Sphaerisporangium perillae]|uniref:hypothetical protein n=1 Tax=Sphaerisporangium perillae TaxID=2935860 RepID=UPI00201092BE|nr:hypothetical protein [Sphaerisporangium perillae]
MDAGELRHARRFLGVWAGLIAFAFGVGGILHAFGVLTIDHLPPLHAHFRVLTITLLPAGAFAAVAVAALPRLVLRGGFGRALLLAYGCTLAWTVLLAVSADGLAAPLARPTEYLAVLPAVGDDPLGWLASFTERLPGYPTHVRGHPPLPVLALWGLARLGLAGPFAASVLVVAVACSATVAIGLVVRNLAGEGAARQVLPYLALAPSAVWIATSMDAFFAGIGAWGVALLVLAGQRAASPIPPGVAPGRPPSPLREPPLPRRSPRLPPPPPPPARPSPSPSPPPSPSPSSPAPVFLGVLYGLVAGILLGALPYLSYGLVPYLLIPVAAAMVARVPRAAVTAALAGAAGVSAAFAAAGFLWPAGVLATHAEWAADPGAARPYWYFLVANMAVLALVTGPATAAGLARFGPVTVAALARFSPVTAAGLTRFGPVTGAGSRWYGLKVLVGTALVAVLALDVSGVTRGEVERIWIPYALWIGLAASLAGGRRWLAAQALIGLLLQSLVLSPW